MMKGWKTWLGATMIGGAAVVEIVIPGSSQAAYALRTVGEAVVAIGLGHKLEKKIC